MDIFDYDKTAIHMRYDRARKLPVAAQLLWLDILEDFLPCDKIRTIADIGCGTGRFSTLLAERFSAKVYAVDPSGKMLGSAKGNTSLSSIVFLKGSAEKIPIDGNSIDMLFLSMVYHHIREKGKAVFEFKRVLRDNGYICIRNSTQQNLGSYIWLKFFPKAFEIESGRVPDRADIADLFQANGFDLIRHKQVEQLFAKDHLEYVKKISDRGLSSLQAIPDGDFNDGLLRLESYCHKHSDQPVYEAIDLYIFKDRR